MVFNTGAALLDAIVLAVVSREDEGTYGYKITQDVRKAIDVSESTLYPVLRRLQKGDIWKSMTGSLMEETDVIIKLQKPEEPSLSCTGKSGKNIPERLMNYLREGY